MRWTPPRQGLADIIPDRIDIAIPRGRRTPALQSPANIHVLAKDTFGLAREVIRVGDELPLGLLGRTLVIDMIRLRHRKGAEIAWEALRRWLRRRRASVLS